MWRVSLGIGVVPPLSLLYLRIKLKVRLFAYNSSLRTHDNYDPLETCIDYMLILGKEPEAFSREKFKKGKTPYWLAVKFYGPRLVLVSTIWFIYDFLTYPFSIYSSVWIAAIQPHTKLWQNFGWSVLVNFFYLPGALVSLPYFRPSQIFH